jgi:tRNA-Thr(GGU) m(6)t(6)A37 methyltransferase TsaA
VDEVLKWIILQPLAVVRNARLEAEDDNWGEVVSTIELVDEMPSAALDGLESFSHIEVLFYFHGVPAAKVITGARHPRNNPAWPPVGILAQRGKNRPNRLGSTVVRLLRREGRTLHVVGLDAIDGTPVLDIKPVMREFLPREPVDQPTWASELMAKYW